MLKLWSGLRSVLASLLISSSLRSNGKVWVGWSLFSVISGNIEEQKPWHEGRTPRVDSFQKVILNTVKFAADFCTDFRFFLHCQDFLSPLSRLSFLVQSPWTPEGFVKGSLKGSLKCFSRSLYLSAEGPFNTPSECLQEPLENLSRRCRNRWCVRLPGALKLVPGCGGPVAGNESS